MRLSSECRQTFDTYRKVSSAKCRQEIRVTTSGYGAADNLPTATNTLSPMLTTDWALSRRAPMCRQGPNQNPWPPKPTPSKCVLMASVNKGAVEAGSTPRALRSHEWCSPIPLGSLRPNFPLFCLGDPLPALSVVAAGNRGCPFPRLPAPTLLPLQRRTPWPSRVAVNRGLGTKPCR
jgi:hypothetical protein